MWLYFTIITYVIIRKIHILCHIHGVSVQDWRFDTRQRSLGLVVGRITSTSPKYVLKLWLSGYGNMISLSDILNTKVIAFMVT